MSEKTQALLQKLQDEVASLTTEDKWQEYLRLQALFHDYSFRNILLIRAQRPSATAVAGFHTWRKMGRHVKKGETGIAILAPMTFRGTSTAREGAGRERGGARASAGTRRRPGADASASKTQSAVEGALEESCAEGASRKRGFRQVHVFDLSQTDGDPLPDSPTTLLTGHEDQAAVAFELLEAFAREELSMPVEDVELPRSTHGYFDRKDRRIGIRAGNPGLQRAKTLAHEIGHAILHADDSDSHERPVMEVEAESVAFIVMNHLGLDSGDYSFGYVALWGQEKDAAKVIQECGTRIAQAANRVIAFLHRRGDDDARARVSPESGHRSVRTPMRHAA